MDLAPGATLLACTDGLIERRGEHLEAGLARVRAHLAAHHETVGELVASLGEELLAGGSDDDTVILAVAWPA